MRTVSSLLFVLSLTTASLSAERAVLTAPVGSQDCPVSFSLERNSRSGSLSPVQVAGGRPSDGTSAKRSVQVTLRSQEDKAITEASITLYAPRVSNNATPARVVFGQAQEADLVTKTYHLVQDKTAKGPLAGELNLLDTMAGVESASIRSVTYADGSTWRPVNGAACVAAPSNFTQVARR